MEYDATAESVEEPTILFQWSARKLQPVVLLYVAAVFVAFMALSFFVFHSMTAVMALAMTAVAAIVPLVPSVLMKIEYRITERGLERRTLNRDEPQAFEKVFGLKQLDHVVPIGHGFKFYFPCDAPSALKRFWLKHMSDRFSGEVHIEKADQENVVKLLAEQGVAIL